MDLHINPAGVIRCLYGEWIDLSSLGELSIRRASHVEPDGLGQWWVDLSPVGGPRLGPFSRRSQALEAEEHWLANHLLGLSAKSAVSPITLNSEGGIPCHF
jgi:hypothetical protein